MIHTKLKQFRQNSGISVNELCKRLNINGPSYRRYERGEVPPRIDLCIEICKAMDCTLDDIWCEPPEGNPEVVDVSYRAKPGQTVFVKIDVDDTSEGEQAYRTPVKVRPRKKESKVINGG